MIRQVNRCVFGNPGVSLRRGLVASLCAMFMLMRFSLRE